MPSHTHLVEDSDYDGQVVSHTVMDMDAMDSPEDRIREAIALGHSIAPIIAEITANEIEERTNEAVARLLCLIADSRRPKLTIDYISYAVGMGITEGRAGSKLARKHGVSKQAFSQAALKLIRRLGLKPSRAMRSLAGRRRMSEAYKSRANNYHANSA